MVTLSLLFLFGVIGLAVDLGWCYYLKSAVQTAADAAASAGAVYAYNNGDTCSSGCGTPYTCDGTTPPTNSLQAGCLYAAANGPLTLSATMLENNSSNQSAGVAGNAPALWVQATVSTATPMLFLYSSGFHNATISASATAGITTIPASSCIYLLGTTANTTVLSVTGASALSTRGCGIYVKSSYSKAIDITGSSSVKSGCNSSGNSCTGPIWVGGRPGFNLGGTSTISPAPTTSQTVTDPLASMNMPSWSSCNSLTASGNGYSIGNSNTATVDPGTYCGGIKVMGAAKLTLNSGTYVLLGGGLNVSNSGVLNGSGVTFYNTHDSSASDGMPGGAHTAGAITGTGAGVMNLSAPSAGAYQGMLFMQDRNQPTAASFANSAQMNVTGTFYFPDAAVSLTGAENTPIYAAFVAWSLTISGSSALKQDSTGQYTGLAKHMTGLIQ
ncbi:MAG: hypothetical protein KGN84_09050 [Acidobacteriota bacterium]|nr:hypothetical protein [Acidobacteriota bacterium]